MFAKNLTLSQAIEGMLFYQKTSGNSPNAVPMIFKGKCQTCATRLTFESLNTIGPTGALPDQRMKRRVGVAKVVAVRCGASISSGANPPGLTACALTFTPREHTRFARVAYGGCGMWAATHWAIVVSARLERTQCVSSQ